MKITQFKFCFLLALFLCGFGCSSSKPTPDPLTGWHTASKTPDQIIEKDYQDYIQKLSPEEKRYIGVYGFYEDGTGQRAVKIEVDLGGKDCWYHVLIYDKENKRVKTIKYFYGRYQS